MNFADYLDSLSPEERVAWSDGPSALVAARGRPFTLADGPSLSPGGFTPTPTLSPVPTAPTASGVWRSAASMQALSLANAVALVLRSYPASPVTTALFVTPLRTFGLLVLDPARMSVENARSTLNGLAALLRGTSYVSAGGAAELRAGLDRIVALVPAATGTGTVQPPTFTPGGGGFVSTPGPRPSTGGGGGGGTPPPSTSGCPTNASPGAPGTCVCNVGFTIDPTGTGCVPVVGDATACNPGFRRVAGVCVPVPAASGGSAKGWLLLLLGTAVAYRALKS